MSTLLPLTRSHLRAALLAWEQDHRAGLTLSYAKSTAKPVDETVDACLLALWNRLEQSAAPLFVPPAIGARWPGHEGVYAGVAQAEDGRPDGHLILLDAKPRRRLNWAAGSAWAKNQGDAARMPTRTESALLYANLKAHFKEGWHWTLTQFSESDAFYQNFDNGDQDSYDKSAEAWVRAVRRFDVQSFSPLLEAA